MQCPKKHLSPTGGKRVGGVSERPAREAWRSDLLERSWSRRWKAPGLRKVGGLRGTLVERGSRLVRHVRRGLLLGGRSHQRQRVLFGRRGGERRRLAANKARAPDARVLRKDSSRQGDTSFTRSEGPCTSILTTHLVGQLTGGQADRKRIAVGQAWATRKNRHRGGAERTKRGSPCVTAPARERA